MASYVYKGLTEAQKKDWVAAHLKGLVPPEKRGEPFKYEATKDDSPKVVKEKEALTAKWLAEREKEVLKEAEEIDAKQVILGTEPGAKPVEFHKGKPVEVRDGSSVQKKLEALCGNTSKGNNDSIYNWAKVESKRG